MSLIYQINKGMGKPIVFKGVKGQYIGYLAVGMVLLLLGFTLGYLLGTPLYLLVPMVLALGAGLMMGISALSKRFGTHGLAKFMAKRAMPDYLRFHSRRVFTGLRERESNRERQVRR